MDSYMGLQLGGQLVIQRGREIWWTRKVVRHGDPRCLGIEMAGYCGWVEMGRLRELSCDPVGQLHPLNCIYLTKRDLLSWSSQVVSMWQNQNKEQGNGTYTSMACWIQQQTETPFFLGFQMAARQRWNYLLWPCPTPGLIRLLRSHRSTLAQLWSLTVTPVTVAQICLC